MTKEEQEIQAKLQAEADAKKKEEAKNANAEEAGEPSKDKIDYEAELETERKKREEAEKAAADLAFKLRNKQRKDEEEIEEEADKPLTSKDLQAMEQRLVERNEKTAQENKAIEIARANTSSEAEAQLALLKWKDVKSSGDVEKDILFAIGGINYKKVVAEKAELARAIKAKETTYSDTALTQQDGQPKVEPKLPANSPLKQYEYKGNGLYAKKLASGKTMFKNTKAMPGQPKVWVV